MTVLVSKRHPDMPPPPTSRGAIGWLRENLFSSLFNTLLTFASVYLIYVSVVPLAKYLFIDAAWTGNTLADCPNQNAACWPFVRARFHQIIYGFYPAEQRWRVNIVFLILIFAAVPMFVRRFHYKLWLGIFLLVPYPIIAYFLFAGGVFGLAIVETGKWGGLMLTLVIAITAMVVSLPLGILLALGRRSNMAALSTFCVGWIEFWRGVPMLAVLFVAISMFPFFMPENFEINELVRAVSAFAFVMSAFLAEVVRGGLQGVHKGQYEAAAGLGFGYWRMMGLVILPQALRMVIPAIVSNFIILFKETALVQVIGLFDLLGVVQLGTTTVEWISEHVTITGYFITAAIYWLFCFGMSRYSHRLERRMNRGL